MALVGALAAVGPATSATALPRAEAPPVTCGSVITTDTTLGSDLVCPDGLGLVVRGHVTLDFAGHTLTGVAPGETPSDTAAVRVDEDSEVTLVDGVITGWSESIALVSDADSLRPTVHVSRMTFRDGYSGIVAGWRATVDVDRSRFERLQAGVFGYNAATTVTASTFVDTERAVEGVEGALVRVTGSTFRGSTTAVRCGNATCELSESTFRDNATAVEAWYGHGTVERNRFTGNDRAIYVSWESDLEVVDNVVRGNTVGVESGVLDASVVRHNVFTGNGTGIRTESVSDGPGTSTMLDQNVLTRNGDGILADQPGLQLTGNAALHNDGWGIHVVGAVDLGGNVARGNGRYPQCVGVVCRSGGHPVS